MRPVRRPGEQAGRPDLPIAGQQFTEHPRRVRVRRRVDPQLGVRRLGAGEAGRDDRHPAAVGGPERLAVRGRRGDVMARPHLREPRGGRTEPVDIRLPPRVLEPAAEFVPQVPQHGGHLVLPVHQRLGFLVRGEQPPQHVPFRRRQQRYPRIERGIGVVEGEDVVTGVDQARR
ncbi:hypothetical protein GZL_05900 [Streptomyces sp. 769]|nr:hypothetical protein GZL_05900 [Streptomyces sp. 769]